MTAQIAQEGVGGRLDEETVRNRTERLEGPFLIE